MPTMGERLRQLNRRRFDHRATFKNVSSKDSFSSWSSLPFAERIAASPESRDSVKTDFSLDLESYLREFVLLQNVIRYSRYGRFGITDGYSDSVGNLCLNQAAKLAEAGMSARRALLEAQVFNKFECWVVSDAEPDEALVVISPRGTLYEGYPGLDQKHYNCLYLFQKNADNTARFFQFRSWDTNQQLQSLLDQLGSLGQRLTVEIETDAPEEHRIFSQLFSLPSTPEEELLITMDTLMQQHKEHWKINPDRIFPIVASELLEQQVAQVNEAAAIIFEHIFPIGAQPSNLVKNQTKQLDIAVRVIKEALQRWTHDNASNFKTHTNTQAHKIITSSDIIRTWQAFCKNEENTASLEEKDRVSTHLSTTLLPLSSPIHQAASLLHCGIGTFIPANLTSLQALSISNPALLAAEARTLSPTSKHELRQNLRLYVPITIHGEKWFVPPDYLDHLGCAYDPLQGSVVGPCIDPSRVGTGRIPLREDPQAYTAEQFRQLLVALEETQLATNAFDDFSELERTTAVTLFRWLSTILLEQSVGFEAGFMRSDYVTRPSQSDSPTLFTIYRKIHASFDSSPIAALIGHIHSLIEKKLWIDVTQIAQESAVVRRELLSEATTLRRQVSLISIHSLHRVPFSQDQGPQESTEYA